MFNVCLIILDTYCVITPRIQHLFFDIVPQFPLAAMSEYVIIILPCFYFAAIRDYEAAAKLSENDRQIKEGLEKAQRLLKQSQKRDYYKILGVKRWELITEFWSSLQILHADREFSILIKEHFASGSTTTATTDPFGTFLGSKSTIDKLKSESILRRLKPPFSLIK